MDDEDYVIYVKLKQLPIIQLEGYVRESRPVDEWEKTNSETDTMLTSAFFSETEAPFAITVFI